MKKIIAFSLQEFGIADTQKEYLEKSLLQFIETHKNFNLHNEKDKKIDPAKIDYLNQIFKSEEAELISKIEKYKLNSSEFTQKLNNLLESNKNNHFMTDAEIYYIALKSMEKDVAGKVIDALLDTDLVSNRLLAQRTDATFRFPVPPKGIGKKIFLEQDLLTLEAAQKLYGKKINNQRIELILAGGDATRFKKIYSALETALAKITDPNTVLDEKFFEPLIKNSNYDDIKQLFNTEKITSVLNSPEFHSIGLKAEDFKKDEKGNFYALDIKNAIAKAKKEYDDLLPKALNYVYETEIDGKKLFISYFTSHLIQMTKQLKKENKYTIDLYYIVRNAKDTEAFKKELNILEKNGLIDPEKITVKFIDKAKDGLATDPDTGQLAIINGAPKYVSTGHGAAFIKGLNNILSDKKTPVASSTKTVDNSGTNISEFTAISLNANYQENELREKLLACLETNNKNALISLILNPKYGFDSIKYNFDKTTEEIAQQIIKDHWFATIDKTKNISEQIKNRPITIAFIVPPQPFHIGGGLHINAETRELAIVDNIPGTPEDQVKKKDYAFFFNPMLFSTLITQPLNKSIEKDALFVTKKGTPVLKQGESASTHLATDPSTVLKRLIIVPEDKLERVFVQQKTIDETDVNIASNKDLARSLAKQIKKMAASAGLKPAEAAQVIANAQKQAINHLSGKKDEPEKSKPLIKYQKNGVEILFPGKPEITIKTSVLKKYF